MNKTYWHNVVGLIALILILGSVFTPSRASFKIPSNGFKAFAMRGIVIDTLCDGDSLILVGRPQMVSYVWSNGDTNQAITVSPIESTWFWVDQEDDLGIILRDSFEVRVFPLPVITDSSADTIVIEPGKDTIIYVISDEVNTIIWNTGQTGSELLVSTTENRIFTAEVVNQAGCSVKKDFQVLLDYNATLNFTFDSVCVGAVTTLVNTTETNDTVIAVLWDLDGTGVFNAYAEDTVRHTYEEAGNHLVGIRVYFKHLPMMVYYRNVLVGSIPNVVFEWEGSCSGNTTNLSDYSTSAYGEIIRYYYFYAGDTISRFKFADHIFDNAGTYLISLKVITDIQCADSVTDTIVIVDKPGINFNASTDTRIYYNRDTIYFEKGTTLGITAEVVGTFDSVFWQGQPAGQVLEVTEEGEYQVSVFNEGCYNSAVIQTIFKGGGGATEIMNLITPNGDGYNDNWLVGNPSVIYPIKVVIYNRSGKQVYSSEAYQNDWQGQSNGNPLPQATYYYIIEDANGNQFKGPVTIIR